MGLVFRRVCSPLLAWDSYWMPHDPKRGRPVLATCHGVTKALGMSCTLEHSPPRLFSACALSFGERQSHPRSEGRQSWPGAAAGRLGYTYSSANLTGDNTLVTSKKAIHNLIGAATKEQGLPRTEWTDTGHWTDTLTLKVKHMRVHQEV